MIKPKSLKTSNVTLGNMSQVFEIVDKKLRAKEICKEYGLNITLLRQLFKFRAHGDQTIEISNKLGIHRVTVSRYIKALRSMKESEFNFLYEYINKGDNNENKSKT